MLKIKVIYNNGFLEEIWEIEKREDSCFWVRNIMHGDTNFHRYDAGTSFAEWLDAGFNIIKSQHILNGELG